MQKKSPEQHSVMQHTHTHTTKTKLLSSNKLKLLCNTAETDLYQAPPTPGGRSQKCVSLQTNECKNSGLTTERDVLPSVACRRLCWFTLVFVPGWGCYRTFGGPLHCDQLVRVVTSLVMQQEFLNCPLFDLQEQKEMKDSRGGRGQQNHTSIEVKTEKR